MRHKLFVLTSLLVIFSMILPAGGLAAYTRSSAEGAESQPDAEPMQISIPFVEKNL